MPARKLTKAELFYIDGHLGKKTAAQIAADLGLSVHRVAARLKKSGDPYEPPPGVPKPQTFFAEYKGTTCMTGAQSEADDIAAGAIPDPDGMKAPYNPAFFETVKQGIHVIDPSKPIR